MNFIDTNSLYEQIGGTATIEKLVNAFYPKVYADPDLIPLFIGDMDEIKRKQKMFLTQLTGGPSAYSNEFGPPAMRMRHLPFEITTTRERAWLRCMKEAFEEVGLTGNLAELFFNRLKQIASVMVNTKE